MCGEFHQVHMTSRWTNCILSRGHEGASLHHMVLEEVVQKEQDTQKEGPKELTFSLGRGAHRVSGEE